MRSDHADADVEGLLGDLPYVRVRRPPTRDEDQ
jgi:hypothetical protein